MPKNSDSNDDREDQERVRREIEDANPEMQDYRDMTMEELQRYDEELFILPEDLPQSAELYRTFDSNDYDDPYGDAIAYAAGIGAGMEYFGICEMTTELGDFYYELYDLRG